MSHLKNNLLIKLGAKAPSFIAKQGLSLGLKALGMASGPLGWALSFLGKQIIENKIAPHSEALAIRAMRNLETRQNRKSWRKLEKEMVKANVSVIQFIKMRKEYVEEKNK